jgi:hypothetical protein
MFANKQADIKNMDAELIQQIHADLEDKDIHPMSISLNDNFIYEWLQRTLVDGGFEESSDTFEETIRPEFERISDIVHPTNPSTAPKDVVLSDGNIDNGPTIHAEEPDPEEILTTPPDDLDGAKALGIDDVSRPPSRTESTSSHRSKPEDWRPYDTPNAAWVRDMLLPLFDRDPFVDVAETNPDLRIKRAFHQQDYDRKGAIADHKVLRLCEDLMKTLGLSERVNELRNTVYAVDSDGNGQFDAAEYMTLMKLLIKTVMDVKKEMLLTTLTECGSKAEEEPQKKTTSGTLYEHPKLLLWGWSPTPKRSIWPFQDTIADEFDTEAPLLPGFSFTMMAEKARIAVEKIDDFEERWLRLVPKEPQRREEFQAPLEVARELAYRFKLFENQKDRQARSDLDTVIYANQILRTCGVSEKKIPFQVLDLPDVRTYTMQITRLIQGFVFILEEISRELGRHEEAHYYPKLNEKLRSHQVTLLAKLLTLEVCDWNNQVTKKVETYRNAGKESLVNVMEPRCKLLASRYHNRLNGARDDAKRQLSKWSVYLEKVEITNWKIPRSRRLLGAIFRLFTTDHN